MISSVIPFVVASAAFAARYMMGGGRQGSGKVFEQANGVATDAFGNIRIVHAYRAAGNVVSLYRELLQGPTRTELKSAQAFGLGMGSNLASAFGVYALAVSTHGRLLPSGIAPSIKAPDWSFPSVLLRCTPHQPRRDHVLPDGERFSCLPP